MRQELRQIERELSSRPHVQMERTSLFPGIEVYFISTAADLISIHHPELGQVLEINYCKSGRIGWKMENGNQLYLGAGDFSLHTLDACANSTLSFPTGEYQGMTLYIDLAELEAHSSEYLIDADRLARTLRERYCQNGAFASFACGPDTASIFAGFYGQPEAIRTDYQKVKCLELLLYLSKMEATGCDQLTGYQSELVEIVHTIHGQLTKDMGQRITIEELSKQYAVNPTTLKATFKSVYGNSLAAHIKEHRMELAARLLRETDDSIAEIGQKVGYESQGKFTTAFKSHFHILPKEYRKAQRDLPNKRDVRRGGSNES